MRWIVLVGLVACGGAPFTASGEAAEAGVVETGGEMGEDAAPPPVAAHVHEASALVEAGPDAPAEAATIVVVMRESGVDDAAAADTYVNPCGPKTCSGCCTGETCEMGTAYAACGWGGVACVHCVGVVTCGNGACN